VQVAVVMVAGRYRLDHSLGVGGMGRVWLAHDEVLQREVAIKEVALPAGLSDDEREELRLRTLREARAAGRVSHPNVVQIYDVVHGGEQPWIVMEYVPARSLLQLIEEQGPLPVPQVALIGLAILSALAAANRAGVLHRDVKPSNVLVGDDGRVVLTDFGSAVLDDNDSTITKAGLVLGSPEYIAPERARTGISTPESDLWSLGATLYAAAEGRPPFHRPSVLATLAAVATQRPHPIRQGTALKPVISGLLKKDPATRMSAFDTERRLARLAGLESEVPAVPAVQRRRVRLAVASVTALAAIGGLIVVVQAPHPTPDARWAATTGDTHSSGRPAREQPLPATLTWWHDQDGFIIPMPTGWRAVREGSTGVFFRDPDGPRTLRVHAWNPPATDPVVALTREEARTTLANYHRLRIQVLPNGQGAEWEYTYTGATGEMHGLERGFVVDGHAYLIQWRIPVSAWLASLTDYTAIVDGFHR
jgi:eukaryotic-like serine/threonine-protein kinase